MNTFARFSKGLTLAVVSALWIGCAGGYQATALEPTHPASPRAPAAAWSLSPDVLAAPTMQAVSTAQADPHAGHTPATPVAATPLHKGSTMSYDPTAAVPAEKQALVDELMTAYLRITEGMATDSVKDLDARLAAMRAAATGVKSVTEAAALADTILANLPAQGSDLETLRRAWQRVSPGVIKLARTLPASASVAGEVVQAYCPMAKAPWLQTGTDVRNPYYGTGMLTCGSIGDALPVAPAAKSEAPHAHH